MSLKEVMAVFPQNTIFFETLCTPQSTEVPYLDHGEPENEPIEKVYVTTLVSPHNVSFPFLNSTLL